MLIKILYITLLSALLLSAQTGNSSLLYDIGIMINDSVKIETKEKAAPILDQNEASLEEELNRYQQQLAETEVQLRVQTRIIDSLQTEIVMIKAARETDMALMSTKITALVDEREKAAQQPSFIPGASSGSDREFAELDRPWSSVKLNTTAPTQVVRGP